MRWFIALLFLVFPISAQACEDITFRGNDYTVCQFDPAKVELRLFLNHPNTGEVLGSFRVVENLLRKDGISLLFAMNAGMYHSDRSPVGHYVENGKESKRLITSAGPGNFGLLPNGVFCFGDGIAMVYETLRYERTKPACRYATQSGPMLVIDGKLHPRFLEDSDSRYIRNGVGTSADGRSVWFAISDHPVNFHSFGTLFRDHLKTPQALYFDGNISRLYDKAQGRSDSGFPLGPIVGVVAPQGN